MNTDEIHNYPCSSVVLLLSGIIYSCVAAGGAGKMAAQVEAHWHFSTRRADPDEELP